MRGNPVHNTRPHIRLPLFPGHECIADLKTERSFSSQTTWVIYVFGLFFDMLPMGVCSTRHWQTSDRLVQELFICTVAGRKYEREVLTCKSLDI